MKKVLTILLLVFFGVGSLLAQRSVSGKITTAAGESLIGASILVKGTSVGTATDINGDFTLEVPEGSNVLVVSYTGFKTQEVEIGERTVVDIVLEEQPFLVSEVVVTGVGAATDTRRTAISVESLNSDDLLSVSSGSIDRALTGKIPGAIIQSTSGQPGQQANIILRGINTLGGTTPMIMIDGVQINTDNNFNGSARNSSSRLADIDFNNVERIEVVQGAAAATIYGAQGANGVIQIFTKKGQKGAPRISLSTVMGTSDVLRGDFAYAEFHAYQTLADGRMTSGGGAPVQQNQFGVWSEPLLESENDSKTDNAYVEPTYNLLDQVFREDFMNSRTSLSVTGGGDRMTYAVTGSFNAQESAIFGRDERLNAGLNLGFELAPELNLRFGTSIVRGFNTTGAITGTDNVFSALSNAVTTYPFIDFTYRDKNGNLVSNPTGDNSVNPLFTQAYRDRRSKLVRVIPNINLNYKPFEFLELDYKYGIDHYRNDYQDFIDNQEDILGNSNQGGIDPINGRIEKRLRQGTTQNSILTGFLRTRLGDDIQSTTQIAYDWRKRTYFFDLLQGTGLPNYKPVTLRSVEQSDIDEYQEEFITYGFLVNEKLEWKERVGISGGVRVDWSSAFGQGSDPFVFPRGDVYLRLSEFDFWSNAKSLIPEWKIRAAYGEAGVQPGAFDRIVTLEAGQLGSGGYLASNLNQTNPLLDVQVSKELEIGTDLSFAPSGSYTGFFPFFKLGFTYWTRNSEDVIRAVDVAPSTGALTILDNAISMESDGIQLSLNATIYESNTFGWNLTTNFGTTQTTVTDIAGGVDIPVDDNFLLKPGEKLGTFRGQRVLTSLTETKPDGSLYIEDPTNYTIVPESGYVVDKTTNNVVMTDDVVSIGNGMPDFTLSFINDFVIGDALRVGFQLDLVQGFEIYNQTKQWGYRDNLHGDVDDPVTVEGNSGAFLNYYRSLYNTNKPNSHFIEDGSFVRLRNAYVAFDLAKMIRIDRFNRLELELSGYNLFTITNYTGFDPEAASDFNDPTRIGLDQYAFPNSRILQVGLNVGFQ